MGTIDSMKSILTQSALDALCEKFHIPDTVHPELPGPNDRIRNSPTGKISVYSRFFDFANYRIPLSQFLIDILGYFRINLSQLSMIAAAKISYFEILCRVHGFVPTVGNFRRFYINSKNKGWMSFSKRSDTCPVCYTKPLDSLKNWNDHFFWVDASIFSLSVLWHNNKTLRKDPPPTPAEFNAKVYDYLAHNPAPFKKISEPFLCFVGISQYYELDENCYPTFWTDDDEEMDLFSFIHHADPTKVRIGEREAREGDNEVVQDEGVHVVNEESGDAALLLPISRKERKKEKTADGAGGSVLPLKKLREDHGTSGIGASTSGKYVAMLQSLLEGSTLHVEVGVTATAMLPFITSSVSLTPEREGGSHTDSVNGPNLHTRRVREMFVVLSNSSYHSSTIAADDEVTSIIMSPVPPPPVLTVVVATTIIVDATFALAPRAGTDPVPHSIFRDFASTGEANEDVADVDSETLRQPYIPKWNVTNDSALGDPDICCGVIDHLAPPVLFTQLRNMNYEQLFVEFNVGAAHDDVVVLKNSESEEEDVKEDESDHNKERYTFEDDDDDGEFDDLD
ncbi:hypothetical protein Tco_0039382 [Tanacetum coccineum]